MYIVHLTEMEKSSAQSYTKICREKSLIKHKEIKFDSIVYTTYVKEM